MKYSTLTHFINFFTQQASIGQKTVQAIQRRYGTSYLVGPIYSTICKFIFFEYFHSKYKFVNQFYFIFCLIDPAAGDTIDWVYDSTNTNLTFVFEFRDHRNGNKNYFNQIYVKYTYYALLYSACRPIWFSFAGRSNHSK